MNRRTATAGLLFATLSIASCANKTRATGTNSTNSEFSVPASNDAWSGRISLQIQSDPPQAFFAGFALKGSADSGELALISPLGSILGMMRWTPTGALLEQGGNITRFASTDDLLAQATGAAVPMSALFDWLAGENTATPGWLADLSQRSNGRISAKRTVPAPPIDLRLVLDK